MMQVFLASDHVTPATGKTVAVTISKAGGAFGNPNAGASNATEVSGGWYKFALDTTDTGTLGDLVIVGTATSCDVSSQVGYVVSATTGGATNLDAAVSSRMAAYTQPTGFLAATFPSSVASPTNITAGTITTVTTLSNLPSIPSNWLTAAGIAASALNGKGDWLLSSSYTAPTNLTAAQIATAVWQDTTAGDFTASGSIGKSILNGVALGTGLTVANLTNAPTNGDLTSTMKTSVTTSATAATPTAAAVTGNVGGNVVGSVASVTGLTASDVGNIKAKTDNLPSDPADASDIASSFSTVNTKLDTIDDFLDTEVAAIKAQTDNLPSDPADQSLIIAATNAIMTRIGEDGAGLTNLGDARLGNLDAAISGLPGATAIAAAVWAYVVDGTNTAVKLMRGASAALLGKASGLAGTTATFRNVPDTKDVITATVDSDGNRTAVTLDLS